ncbi:ARMT1-like domain-containing protein [Candidatus Omnitrophota bacterium]
MGTFRLKIKELEEVYRLVRPRILIMPNIPGEYVGRHSLEIFDVPNRVGTLSVIAQAIFDSGVNILGPTATALTSNNAGTYKTYIDISEPRKQRTQLSEKLNEALKQIESLPEPGPSEKIFRITAYAVDRIGLEFDITRVLANLNCSIPEKQDLSSPELEEKEGQSYTTYDFIIEVPEGINEQTIQKALESLSNISVEVALATELQNKDFDDNSTEAAHNLRPIVQFAVGYVLKATGAMLNFIISQRYAASGVSKEFFRVAKETYNANLEYIREINGNKGPPTIRERLFALTNPVARGISSSGNINWLLPNRIIQRNLSDETVSSIQVHESQPSELKALIAQYREFKRLIFAAAKKEVSIIRSNLVRLPHKILNKLFVVLISISIICVSLINCAKQFQTIPPGSYINPDPQVTVFVVDSGVDTSIASGVEGEENDLFDSAYPFIHGSLVAKVIQENNNGYKVVSIALSKDRIPEINPDTVAYGLKRVSSYVEEHPGERAVVNLSVAFSEDSSNLYSIIQELHQKGVVIVAAVGNDNCSENLYPAAYPEVIAVAALEDGTALKKASYSDYGSYVDVAALGKVSFVDPWFVEYGSLNHFFSSWGIGKDAPKTVRVRYGTSFAAPRVASLAGNIELKNPNLSGEQVIRIIEETADPLDETLYKDGLLGKGVINPDKALSFAEKISVDQSGRYLHILIPILIVGGGVVFVFIPLRRNNKRTSKSLPLSELWLPDTNVTFDAEAKLNGRRILLKNTHHLRPIVQFIAGLVTLAVPNASKGFFRVGIETYKTNLAYLKASHKIRGAPVLRYLFAFFNPIASSLAPSYINWLIPEEFRNNLSPEVINSIQVHESHPNELKALIAQYREFKHIIFAAQKKAVSKKRLSRFNIFVPLLVFIVLVTSLVGHGSEIPAVPLESTQSTLKNLTVKMTTDNLGRLYEARDDFDQAVDEYDGDYFKDSTTVALLDFNITLRDSLPEEFKEFLSSEQIERVSSYESIGKVNSINKKNYHFLTEWHIYLSGWNGVKNFIDQGNNLRDLLPRSYSESNRNYLLDSTEPILYPLLNSGDSWSREVGGRNYVQRRNEPLHIYFVNENISISTMHYMVGYDMPFGVRNDLFLVQFNDQFPYVEPKNWRSLPASILIFPILVNYKIQESCASQDIIKWQVDQITEGDYSVEKYDENREKVWDWIAENIDYDADLKPTGGKRPISIEILWYQLMSPAETLNRREGICVNYARLQSFAQNYLYGSTFLSTDGSGILKPEAFNVPFSAKLAGWASMLSIYGLYFFTLFSLVRYVARLSKRFIRGIKNRFIFTFKKKAVSKAIIRPYVLADIGNLKEGSVYELYVKIQEDRPIPDQLIIEFHPNSPLQSMSEMIRERMNLGISEEISWRLYKMAYQDPFRKYFPGFEEDMLKEIKELDLSDFGSFEGRVDLLFDIVIKYLERIFSCDVGCYLVGKAFEELGYPLCIISRGKGVHYYCKITDLQSGREYIFDPLAGRLEDNTILFKKPIFSDRSNLERLSGPLRKVITRLTVAGRVFCAAALVFLRRLSSIVRKETFTSLLLLPVFPCLMSLNLNQGNQSYPHNTKRIKIGDKTFRVSWEIDLGDGTKLLVLSGDNKDVTLIRVDAQTDQIIVGDSTDLFDKLEAALSNTNDLKLLKGLIYSSEPRVRSMAILRLAEIGNSEATDFLFRRTGFVLGGKRGDPNRHVQQALVEAIDKLSDERFVKALRGFVTERAASVRQRALVVLAKLANAEDDKGFAVGQIIAFLQKEGQRDSWDRQWAASAAQNIKDERIIEPLKNALKKEAFSQVRQQLLLALGFQYQGDAEIEEILLEFAQEGNPLERESAVIALGKVETDRSKMVITNIANHDSNPYTKVKAEEVLRQLDTAGNIESQAEIEFKPRELEILSGWAAGQSNDEIANGLVIATKTISGTYAPSIYRKLKIEPRYYEINLNHIFAVVTAAKLGIISIAKQWLTDLEKELETKTKIRLLPRERQILQFWAEGYTSTEIAKMWKINVSTIHQTYAPGIYKKIGIVNARQDPLAHLHAVIKAAELGVISIDAESLGLLKKKVAAQENNPLTPREKELLRLWAAAISNEEIAEKWEVTVSAVQNHSFSVFKKLGMSGGKGGVGNLTSRYKLRALKKVISQAWIEDLDLSALEKEARNPFTKRQKQVLALIAKSKTNKEISQILDIDRTKVWWHFVNICGQLNINYKDSRSRFEVVVRALEKNYLKDFELQLGSKKQPINAQRLYRYIGMLFKLEINLGTRRRIYSLLKSVAQEENYANELLSAFEELMRNSNKKIRDIIDGFLATRAGKQLFAVAESNLRLNDLRKFANNNKQVLEAIRIYLNKHPDKQTVKDTEMTINLFDAASEFPQEIVETLEKLRLSHQGKKIIEQLEESGGGKELFRRIKNSLYLKGVNGNNNNHNSITLYSSLFPGLPELGKWLEGKLNKKLSQKPLRKHIILFTVAGVGFAAAFILLGLGLADLLYLPWLVGGELTLFGLAGAFSFGAMLPQGNSDKNPGEKKLTDGDSFYYDEEVEIRLISKDEKEILNSQEETEPFLPDVKRAIRNEEDKKEWRRILGGSPDYTLVLLKQEAIIGYAEAVIIEKQEKKQLHGYYYISRRRARGRYQYRGHGFAEYFRESFIRLADEAGCEATSTVVIPRVFMVTVKDGKTIERVKVTTTKDEIGGWPAYESMLRHYAGRATGISDIQLVEDNVFDIGIVMEVDFRELQKKQAPQIISEEEELKTFGENQVEWAARYFIEFICSLRQRNAIHFMTQQDLNRMYAYYASALFTEEERRAHYNPSTVINAIHDRNYFEKMGITKEIFLNIVQEVSMRLRCGLYDQLDSHIKGVKEEEQRRVSVPEREIKKPSRIRQRALRETKGLTSERDKSDRLCDFVRNQIRFAYNTTWMMDPEEVLKQGWGMCIDKTRVLGRMHEEIGIPVRYVVKTISRKSSFWNWIFWYHKNILGSDFEVKLSENGKEEEERRRDHVVLMVKLDGEWQERDVTSDKYLQSGMKLLDADLGLESEEIHDRSEYLDYDSLNKWAEWREGNIHIKPTNERPNAREEDIGKLDQGVQWVRKLGNCLYYFDRESLPLARKVLTGKGKSYIPGVELNEITTEEKLREELRWLRMYQEAGIMNQDRLERLEGIVKRLFSMAAGISGLTNKEIEAICSEIVRVFLAKSDLLKELKDDFPADISKELVWIEKLVSKQSDQLLAAVKIAIAANVIGIAQLMQASRRGKGGKIKFKPEIKKILRRKLEVFDYPILTECFKEKEQNILYILDNAGEVVFDLVLIKRLLQAGHRVTFATRGNPISNDVTKEDIVQLLKKNEIKEYFASELKNIKVVSSGSPMKGTDLRFVTREFIKAWQQADFIIAKGEGSWQTLYNQALSRDIFFLVRVKEPGRIKDLSVRQGDYLLKYIPAASFGPGTQHFLQPSDSDTPDDEQNVNKLLKRYPRISRTEVGRILIDQRCQARGWDLDVLERIMQLIEMAEEYLSSILANSIRFKEIKLTSEAEPYPTAFDIDNKVEIINLNSTLHFPLRDGEMFYEIMNTHILHDFSHYISYESLMPEGRIYSPYEVARLLKEGLPQHPYVKGLSIDVDKYTIFNKGDVVWCAMEISAHKIGYIIQGKEAYRKGYQGGVNYAVKEYEQRSKEGNLNAFKSLPYLVCWQVVARQLEDVKSANKLNQIAIRAVRSNPILMQEYELLLKDYSRLWKGISLKIDSTQEEEFLRGLFPYMKIAVEILENLRLEGSINRYYLSGSLARADFKVPPKDVDFYVKLTQRGFYERGEELLGKVLSKFQDVPLLISSIDPFSQDGQVFIITESGIEFIEQQGIRKAGEGILIDLTPANNRIFADSEFFVKLYRMVRDYNKGKNSPRGLRRNEASVFFLTKPKDAGFLSLIHKKMVMDRSLYRLEGAFAHIAKEVSKKIILLSDEEILKEAGRVKHEQAEGYEEFTGINMLEFVHNDSKVWVDLLMQGLIALRDFKSYYEKTGRLDDRLLEVVRDSVYAHEILLRAWNIVNRSFIRYGNVNKSSSILREKFSKSNGEALAIIHPSVAEAASLGYDFDYGERFDEYMKRLENEIQESARPVIIFEDKQQRKAIEDWLKRLKPISPVILISTWTTESDQNISPVYPAIAGATVKVTYSEDIKNRVWDRIVDKFKALGLGKVYVGGEIVEFENGELVGVRPGEVMQELKDRQIKAEYVDKLCFPGKYIQNDSIQGERIALSGITNWQIFTVTQKEKDRFEEEIMHLLNEAIANVNDARVISGIKTLLERISTYSAERLRREAFKVLIEYGTGQYNGVFRRMGNSIVMNFSLLRERFPSNIASQRKILNEQPEKTALPISFIWLRGEHLGNIATPIFAYLKMKKFSQRDIRFLLQAIKRWELLIRGLNQFEPIEKNSGGFGPGTPHINQSSDSVSPRIQIHVSFFHDELYHWLKAEIGAGRLAKGLPLVLFDYHHDADYRGTKVNWATWVYFAKQEGLIGDIYWMRPKWEKSADKDEREGNESLSKMLGFALITREFNDLPDFKGPVIVSIDFDYISFIDRNTSDFHRPTIPEIKSTVKEIVDYLEENSVNVRVADFTKTGFEFTFTEHTDPILETLQNEFKRLSEEEFPLEPGRGPGKNRLAD